MAPIDRGYLLPWPSSSSLSIHGESLADGQKCSSRSTPLYFSSRRSIAFWSSSATAFIEGASSGITIPTHKAMTDQTVLIYDSPMVKQVIKAHYQSRGTPLFLQESLDMSSKSTSSPTISRTLIAVRCTSWPDRLALYLTEQVWYLLLTSRSPAVPKLCCS